MSEQAKIGRKLRVYVTGTHTEPVGTCRNHPEPTQILPEPPGTNPELPGTYPEPTWNHPEPSRNSSEP